MVYGQCRNRFAPSIVGQRPRVALSAKAAEFNRAIVAEFYGEPESSPQATSYLVDEKDGVVFVDHLGVWLTEEDDKDSADRALTRQRAVIENYLSCEKGQVFEKWNWLADMHNHVLREQQVGDELLIEAGETRFTFRSFIPTLEDLLP